jgi:hypothetical protein
MDDEDVAPERCIKASTERLFVRWFGYALAYWSFEQIDTTRRDQQLGVLWMVLDNTVTIHQPHQRTQARQLQKS